MIPVRRMSRFLLALPLALLASCLGSGTDPEWVSAQMPAASDRVLWSVTRIALETQGFHVLTDGFDPVSREAMTAWQIDPHPFKGKGFRERAHVMYDAAGPGRVELSVRVEREINNNLARPLDPEYANWASDPDNPERARLVLKQIQARLGGKAAIGGTPPAPES